MYESNRVLHNKYTTIFNPFVNLVALLVPITLGYNPEYLKPNPEALVSEGGQRNQNKLTKQNKRQGKGKIDIAPDHFNILNIGLII